MEWNLVEAFCLNGSLMQIPALKGVSINRSPWNNENELNFYPSPL